MTTLLPDELWFEIAKYDFDIWKTLIRTIKSFYLYVQRSGGFRLVEKLFGKIDVYEDYISWKISKFRWRFCNLPDVIGNNYTLWTPYRETDKPTGIWKNEPHRFIITQRNTHDLVHDGGYRYHFGKNRRVSELVDCISHFHFIVNWTPKIVVEPHNISIYDLDGKWTISLCANKIITHKNRDWPWCILNYDGTFEITD